ncbi:MAG: hypothetical protein LBS00_12750 [Synergistaceae bacterium]|nr:hypothetical protein [Synergistaceae bacterium]
MEKKRIGLFTITCYCIGTIIGAGVFGSLPKATNLMESTIVVCFIIAAIEVFVRYLPSIMPSAVIPASGGFYMHLPRLVNPYMWGVFNGVDLIAIMSAPYEPWEAKERALASQAPRD